MKRHMTAAAMALLCLGFFCACTHVEDKGRAPIVDDQAQAAPAKEVITVLNPLGTPPPVKLKPMAPRLDRMEGKTIYIVNDGYPGSGIMLNELTAVCKERFPNTTFLFKDREGMGPYAEGFWEEIDEKADAMIIALGH